MSNQRWIERDLAVVWHPCTQMKHHPQLPLVPIRRGQGIWLYDFDGNRYLDGISSWWVNLFGHGHPAIKQAIRDQLDQLDHVLLAGCTHQPVIELSERLCQRTGLAHCSYGSDGASAIEIALKQSYHYWQLQQQPAKRHFLHLSGSYHGETLGALAVCDLPIFRQTYQALLQPGFSLPAPIPQADESLEQASTRALAALERLLAANAQQFCALLVEPLVQGASGMQMYAASYLQGARRLCSQYQVHLIADEIAVGFGRTGTFLACEQAGIVPDLLCLSKGLTGGVLPLSVCLANDRIYQAFYQDSAQQAFLHSHSYTGNPLACAAALATLDLLDAAQLQRIGELGQRMQQAAEPFSNHPAVRQVRRSGMMLAIELKPDSGFNPERFFSEALQRELLLRPLGSVIYWLPPYVITEAEIDWLGRQTLAALTASLES